LVRNTLAIIAVFVLMMMMDGQYSMWHELRVVLHNRENTLLTQVVQAFAREERDYAENVAANWASLVQGVEGMPFE
jgi:sorting nexin-8